MNIFAALESLTFLKEEEITAINKLVSGRRIIDLLLHLPCYYKAFEATTIASEAASQKGQEIKFYGCKIIKITGSQQSATKNSKYRKIPFSVTAQDSSLKEICLNFFQINEAYKSKFKIGAMLNICGKVEIYKDKRTISHPKIEFTNNSSNPTTQVQQFNQVNLNENQNRQNTIAKIIFPRENLNEEDEEEQPNLFDKDKKTNKNQAKKSKINPSDIISIESFYPLTEGLTHFFIKKVIKKIFSEIKKNQHYDDFLNLHLRDYLNCPKFLDSLEKAHFPSHIDDISSQSQYFKRIAMDEVFANQISINLIRNEDKGEGISVIGNNSLRNTAIKNLPFELTSEQQKALNEIQEDQKNPKRMFRLLQGDVGSGKTIVAILSALNTIECGMKVAILAPTSILANQHYATILEIAKNINISTELITGNVSAKNKQNIASMLRMGFIDILVGTHALLYGDMDFSKFGLFIIDEQHSFGVEQRNALNNKNTKADVLMMSATPIPRTLLMSYYGDVQVSIINSKPKNRKPIETKIMNTESYEKILKSIKGAIEKGEKVYWVCPLIEESDKLQFQDAVSRHSNIAEYIDKKYLGIVHGGMSGSQKDEIMKNFLESKIKILVCTTVIEVGVNVPDATIIIIENANKFGLAQLHQLRGRVGRSSLQSYCILLYDKKLSEKGRKRLEILKESNDGFYIAEQDLKMRGGGNILGKQQSGFNIFKVATFFYDKEIIYKLSALSKNIATQIKQNSNNDKQEMEKIKTLQKIFCNFNAEEFVMG